MMEDETSIFKNIDSIPVTTRLKPENRSESTSSVVDFGGPDLCSPYSSNLNHFNYDYHHKKINSFSSSTNYLNHKQQNHYLKHNVHKSSHQRTRSVDLRLSYSSSNSSNSSLLSTSKSPLSNRQNSKLLATIEEKVSKLYYKHGLFCSRYPAMVILFSLLVVFISSYQIFTFRGIFGSSYDIYISSSSPLQDSILLKKNSLHNISTLTHPLMKHLNFWPDSYVRNELDDDQNVPPWFQSNSSYAYVQQIFIRSAVIPWPEDMQLVDALRAPFELIFELAEAVSNFQFKNDFGEEITLNDVCFQVFEPTLSKSYSHITSHLPSYSCLVLSPANIWHGDHTKFLQDQNLLTTLLKFQDLPTSPVPSGAMHDILFGVQFEDTGIRRTYGRNRIRIISYSITLILRKNVPGFLEALRTFLKKRYPISFINKNLKTSEQSSASNRNHNESTYSEQSDQDHLDNKTKHIYFHNTFTYNYLVPLTLIYAIVCFYMYYIVRKVEIIRNKRLYSLSTLITILMSLFMSFGICFRLRFHSVLIVNRLLPYFITGISFENMLVLTKSVLANPHLDSKVRVAQALSKEGLSITKNLLAELTLLSIGSFTFMPFFQECCKIAAVCFISDFFIQITLFTSFFSLLIQRIQEQSINSNKYSSILEKQSNQNVFSYPRNIYARPGEPVQQKTPKRLRFILFMARLRLVQRCFILLLSACIGLAIYNTYLVLEQQTTTTNEHSHLMFSKQNQSATIISTKPEKLISEEITTIPTVSTSMHPKKDEKSRQELSETLNKQSFMKLLETKGENLSGSNSSSSSSSSTTLSMLLRDPYYRIFYTRDNPVPKPFANHHWTNLFSLYNISLVGRFISIVPPMLLSIPISPERARHIRNAADSDYNTLKKFIPMKFTNGEYVISDDDDYDKFEQLKRFHWSKDDLHIIIGLWVPSFIFFIYLFVQLYRCICTRNYAEWRSQLSTTNPLTRLGLFVKRTALMQNELCEDRLIRIDISLLNYDRKKETYSDEKQYLIHNQDIDLVATNVETSLVAASSMSGDLRVYDALTCESLAIIKRSQQTSGPFSIYKRAKIPDESDSDDFETDVQKKEPIIIKSEGNILKTLFYGIQNDTNSDIEVTNYADGKEVSPLDFRPIWCMDIYDRYVLVGCGGDDGRFEVWDAYTGQLSFVYHPDSFKNGYEESATQKKSESYGITVMKATYWGVALARINGQLEMLETEQLKKDKYSIIFQQTPSRSNSKIKIFDQLKYRLKFRMQAHQQPITRIEILDSLEDEEFIKVFGSRGCLISGSMDTTLKVFALDNFKLMYTLNGHCGAIVTTSIDSYSTASSLSGCQLGQLCVWDLNTGTCIFSMQAHSDSEVLSIITSPLYYVTTGTDSSICIWDRYSGHLIHRIPNQHTICRSMVFLEPYILVTVHDSELVIWDCNDARSICLVPLANRDCLDVDPNHQINNKWTKSYQNALIKNLVFSYKCKALICDYGNLLCVINNPFATKKLD